MTEPASRPARPLGYSFGPGTTVSLDDFEDTLRVALHAACELIGWPFGHVLALDASANTLRSTGIWHVDGADDFAEWRQYRTLSSFGPGQGLPGKVRQSGVPLFSEMGDEVETAVALQRRSPPSGCGFPVKCGDELIAVFEFFHRTPQTGAERMIPLARLTGSLLGQLAEHTRRVADWARLADFVEASDDAIIAVDLRGFIVSWNSGAERLYGYTREEAIGNSLRMLSPDGANDGGPVLTRVLRESRRLEQFETIRRRKNGHLIDVSLTAAPVLDRDGCVTGASSIERDITRRKHFEAERAKAQADAESANLSKSEFLANVSHELRTPMNAILGLIELSLGEDLPTAVEDYLATAFESAQVLLSLLNDLLDFSRTEVGTFELDCSPFQLRKALDQVVRTLAVRAHEKGLAFTCRVHADVPDNLVGDARRVQQIVMNLAGNAIKFTDSGEVAIDVARSAPQDDSAPLRLTVSDTGIGISTADQERIFAPFSQVDASSTRKHSGTGLGLAIVRELVHRMDGHVWVESELNRGSRFVCTLRLKGGDRPVQVTAADAEMGVTSGARTRPLPTAAWPLRILVAEDTPANQKVVNAILSKRGHSVEIVEDGMKAVASLQKSAFDVVLMDAQMPTMNGLQAAAAIRHIPNAERARVPIIAMTAHARREDREKCLAAGMDDYLPKPIDATQLIKVVEKYGKRGPDVGRGGVPHSS